MKAQSYGKYDVFDDETALTWEQAEALALRARGQEVVIPPGPPQTSQPPLPSGQQEAQYPMGPFALVLSQDRALLNRALILLIHLRERVFKDDPQVASWVNELLAEAKK